MSFSPLSLDRKSSKSLTALRLQLAGRVRLLVGCVVLLASASAWAQPTSGTGSCSGSVNGGMLAGTVGIALPDMTSIQAASVPFTFSGADCTCSTDDLLLDIFLTSTLPSSTTGTLEFWVGAGCDTNTTARTTQGQTTCEKIDTNVAFAQFVQGTTPTGGHIFISIPARKLFSPVVNQCPNGTTNNGLFVLLFSGVSTSGPASAICSIPSLQLSSGLATPAQDVTAAPGDGAVTLSWTIPTGSTTLNYQVLCADANGNPGRSNPPANIYSTCVDGVMERRALNTGGSLPGGTDDAGTGTASLPLSTSSVPSDPDGVPPAPDATDDGGVSPSPTTGPTVSPLPAPFTQLDKSFVCSDSISSTTNQVRITGLTNGTQYQFVVLAIDNYGNPTWPVTNSVVNATPQPVEDLFRRYRDAGGGGSGFCFIATAAYGSYENRWVQVLREFRDVVLLPTDAGARFVDWYYAHSPGPAAYIAVHPFARALTRIALWPVIGFAAVWLYIPVWLKLAWLLTISGLLLFSRRRRLEPA
jgi:hypothetical protein